MDDLIKEINTMLTKASAADLVVIQTFIKGFFEGRYCNE